MRRISKIALLILLAAAFVLGSSQEGEVRSLQYRVVADTLGNPGGGIRLEWVAPTYNEGGGLFSCSQRKEVYPDHYVIDADGVKVGTTTNTFYYVFTPCRAIEVAAVWDGEKSIPIMLDFEAVETPTLDIWSMDDPDPSHPSGFGFGETGTATAYSVSDSTNNDKIDFFIDYGLKIASPNERVPTVNDERNTTSIEIGSYYVLKVVSPCGNDRYLTKRDLANNGLYGLWIDPTSNGYSTDDNFAKAHVTGINGYKVTLRLAYQAVPGLRWVAN